MRGRFVALVWGLFTGAMVTTLLVRIFVTEDADFYTYMVLGFAPLWILTALWWD